MRAHRLLQVAERVGGLLRAERTRVAASRGLHPVHLHALDYLARCNRYSNTPAAVTRYLGVTKGTASQSLRLLEREGLIEREPDTDDRRVVHLNVTRKGSALLGDLIPLPAWERAAADLPSEEVRAAERLLDSFLRNVQSAHGLRTFGQCATCRHLADGNGTGMNCRLMDAELQPDELLKICQLHEFPLRA